MNNFNIPKGDILYLNEIRDQCQFGIMSLKFLYKVYTNSDGIDMDEFWYHIQMFLSATANVDKLLFGASKDYKYKEHHKRIRLKYKFPDIDFSTERLLRNKVEHLDENIVKWEKSSKNHNVASRNIMSKDEITGIKIDHFRNFDPNNNVLSFDNTEIDTEVTFNKLNILSQHINEILQYLY